MEHYSDIKKNILLYATMWMNLQDIILSEISQPQKNIAWLHLHDISSVVKLINRRMVVAKGRHKGKWGVAVKWVESFSCSRWKGSRDLLYNTVLIQHSTSYCSLKIFLRGLISFFFIKIKNMHVRGQNGCLRNEVGWMFHVLDWLFQSVAYS